MVHTETVNNGDMFRLFK